MAKAIVSDRIFIAVESFSCRHEGADHSFVKDQSRVREGHPVLVGREHLFKVIEPSFGYEVEAASAAPGEKRGA